MDDKTREWEKQEKTVTLTNAEWSNLTCYILMSTSYRTRELEAWRELAQRKDENGTPEFKSAESNTRFWEKLINSIDEIRKKIDEA